jgi:cytochrome P450
MQTTLSPELDQQLLSPAFYHNPYPLYARLRQEAPVVWSERVGAWLITRYEDVITTLRDAQHFSSQGRMLAALDRLSADERAQLQPFEQHFTGGLINSDPPDHTRMRTLINKAFSPRMVEQLRGRVATLVNEFLDAVQDRAAMDVIADLAYPLPATVIAELLGAPGADRERFKGWSEGIFAIQGRGRLTFAQLAQAQEHLLAFRAYLRGLIAARRARPHDDLLGQLVAVEMADDRLSEAELLTTCVTLLTAGHETTTNLIGNTLYTLLQHRRWCPMPLKRCCALKARCNVTRGGWHRIMNMAVSGCVRVTLSCRCSVPPIATRPSFQLPTTLTASANPTVM